MTNKIMKKFATVTGQDVTNLLIFAFLERAFSVYNIFKLVTYETYI